MVTVNEPMLNYVFYMFRTYLLLAVDFPLYTLPAAGIQLTTGPIAQGYSKLCGAIMIFAFVGLCYILRPCSKEYQEYDQLKNTILQIICPLQVQTETGNWVSEIDSCKVFGHPILQGRQQYTEVTTINMFSLIKIRH